MKLGTRAKGMAAGKAKGLLVPLIVILGVAGVGGYWWTSPARKIQGDWDIQAGGLLPVNGTINFKGGFMQKSGSFTTVTAIGGFGLNVSSSMSGSYTLHSDEKPPVLELTSTSSDRKPMTEFSSGKMEYQFIDSDTLQLQTTGAVAMKVTLKRKK